MSVVSDQKRLTEAQEVLEYIGCQYWACDGPTKKPIDMKKTYRYENVYVL